MYYFAAGLVEHPIPIVSSQASYRCPTLRRRTQKGDQMFTTTILVSLLVASVVLIHYEALYRLSLLMPIEARMHRYKILAGVLGALCAHVIEIWLFALGYYFMVNAEAFGTLTGNFNYALLDCVYFSFTVYSTLGLGDIEPAGPIRFLVALEGLTGIMLITWTASFMFVEIQNVWTSK